MSETDDRLSHARQLVNFLENFLVLFFSSKSIKIKGTSHTKTGRVQHLWRLWMGKVRQITWAMDIQVGMMFGKFFYYPFLAYYQEESGNESAEHDHSYGPSEGTSRPCSTSLIDGVQRNSSFSNYPHFHVENESAYLRQLLQEKDQNLNDVTAKLQALVSLVFHTYPIGGGH
jgi:hypothetical protein